MLPLALAFPTRRASSNNDYDRLKKDKPPVIPARPRATLLIPGLLLLMAGASKAQSPPGAAPFTRPIDERPELPAYEPPASMPPLELPPVAPESPASPLSEQLQVHVEKVRIEGNTVFSAEVLAEIAKPWQGRTLDSGDLESLRRALTQHYIDHGYINSGALIPDQQVTDGVIVVQIVEGHLQDTRIEGLRRLRSSYLEDRIALGVSRPLNVSALGEALELLKQNPRIEQLHATLAPGAVPGEALLDVQVAEARPVHFWVGADNTRPPSVGGEQVTLRGVHQNLSGWGDSLDVGADFARALDAYDIRYSLPVSAHDTLLGLRYLHNRSDVIEPPFDTLDITAEEQSFGLSLTHPIYRTRSRRLLLGAVVDRRDSATTLLGQPFSFSPGAENGETRLAVLRLTQEWLDQQVQYVLAARSSFNFGTDALNATVNGADQDGKFVSWIGQAQWARRLGDHGQVITRTALQWSNDSLPSLEQFSVGGLYTVRGYRENQQVTDQGVVASVEFRFPIWVSESGRNRLQFAPFFDYGNVRNRDRPTPDPQHLSGAGAGLVLRVGTTLDAAVYVAHAFQDIVNPSEDIQDDGIHFSISAKLY